MRSRLVRWGGPAAMLGGALYLTTFGLAYLIYDVFSEHTQHNFFGQHAFIHMPDVIMFALLMVGATGVYFRQKDSLGKAGKIGFLLTLAGFGLSVVGGLAIIAIGLLMSDEATLGVLDTITHPLAHFLYATGSLLFGMTIYRAGLLPRGGALLIAAGPIWLFALFVGGFGGESGSLLLLLVPVVVTGLGWTWLGYALFAERKGTVAEPQPAVR